MLYCTNTKKVSLFFLLNTLYTCEYASSQKSEQYISHYSIYLFGSVKEYWTFMKYHTFMIVSLVSSVCIGIFKTCSFIQRMIYDKRKCCLKIHNFVCPKGWILMGKSLVGIPPVRTAFGIKIVNSYKLSFPTHSRNAVNYISHSFYSLKLTAGLIKMYIFLPLNFLPTLIYAD